MTKNINFKFKFKNMGEHVIHFLVQYFCFIKELGILILYRTTPNWLMAFKNHQPIFQTSTKVFQNHQPTVKKKKTERDKTHMVYCILTKKLFHQFLKNL